MISIRCIACGKQYSVKPEKAGKQAKCKQCGARIAIPSPSRTLSPPASLTNDSVCSDCQSPIQPNWRVCQACGNPTSPAQAAPTMSPSPIQPGHNGYGPSPTNMPRSSGIHIGSESVAKITINESVNVNGSASVPEAFKGMVGQGTIGNSPSLLVGDGSVVKAKIDASVNYTNQGQIIGQQNIEYKVVHNTTVVHESGFSKLVNIITTGGLGSDEADKLIEQVGNNPQQLMALAANAINCLSRTLLNYARDEFKLRPGILEEIRSKMHMARKITDKIHEISGTTDTNLSNDIEKIDIILRYAQKIHDDFFILSLPIFSFVLNYFFNTVNKSKMLIELIQLEKNNLVNKYS